MSRTNFSPFPAFLYYYVHTTTLCKKYVADINEGICRLAAISIDKRVKWRDTNSSDIQDMPGPIAMLESMKVKPCLEGGVGWWGES